ncbi:MAG: hypothetical protein LBH11_05385, partial [Propionibacteriaceae bacterium]|nr:hypothetical protein [Propionibacteriaceae bacterium]
MDAPFTLGPYAARNCPVRVQNRFDPTIPPVDEAPTVDPTSATETHRIVVLNELADHARAKGFRVVDLRNCERIERLGATQAAVA